MLCLLRDDFRQTAESQRRDLMKTMNQVKESRDAREAWLEKMADDFAATQHAKEEVTDSRFGLAHTMYEAIAKVIDHFQQKLGDDEEVGACLTSFGQQITIRVTFVGFQDPHLMVFYGTGPDGNEVQLLQHTSQVNLMLVPVPAKSLPARRLGFKLD